MTEWIKAAIESAGELVLPLQGRSMGDKWAQADRIRVVSCARRRPKWGDVVLIRRGERIFAHRVIGRFGDRFWTKGDARHAWDRPLPRREDILGVVAALLPDGKSVERKRGVAVCEAMKALLAWPLLPIIRRTRGRDERLLQSG